MKEIEQALRMAEPLLRSNRYLAEADACKAALVTLARLGEALEGFEIDRDALEHVLKAGQRP